MSKREKFHDLKNFEKQEQIGKGGFSEVFKIKEKETGKIYAAKISKKRLDKNTKEIKELRTNLIREVNIISGLDHPAILKFYGYSKLDFADESKPVIITEYSPNGTLRDIIDLSRQRKTPDTWDDTKKLINIYGIASGISYLHSRDILHRDLKPQNILEDDNLFPQIADFGLALVCHEKQDATTYQPNNKALGTPIYAAPEIWKKNAYSNASDVYAFAYVVYEIMTNEAPFQGYDQDKIFDEVIVNHSRPQFKRSIPEAYRQLIEKCWSDNPNDRPSFSSIVHDLRYNSDFITNRVNKVEFRDYAKFIDQFHTSFDPDKPILQYEEIRAQSQNQIQAQNQIQSLNQNQIQDQTQTNPKPQPQNQITPLNEIKTIKSQIKIIKPKRTIKKIRKKIVKKPSSPSITSLNDENGSQQLKLKQFNIPPNNVSLLHRNTPVHLLPLVA